MTLQQIVVFFACVYVDITVRLGAVLTRAYDTFAVFAYFLYTCYHSWCITRRKTLLRPVLRDGAGVRLEIMRAVFEDTQRDATIALLFSMIFYDWNMKLMRMFMQRVGAYRPSRLDVYIRRDGDARCLHVSWDFETERNLTTNTDIMFGDISLEDEDFIDRKMEPKPTS